MNNKINISRKAISPVIATILLLAVTVIIAVGVYQFINTYTQDTLTTSQQDSNIFQVQGTRVITNSASGEITLQNRFEVLEVNRILVDDEDCGITPFNITTSVERIDLSSCITAQTSARPSITIETEQTIIRDSFPVAVTSAGGAGGYGYAVS